jgi:hypothetical protein
MGQPAEKTALEPGVCGAMHTEGRYGTRILRTSGGGSAANDPELSPSAPAVPESAMPLTNSRRVIMSGTLLVCGPLYSWRGGMQARSPRFHS